MLFIFSEFKTLSIGEIYSYAFPLYEGNFFKNIFLDIKNPAEAGLGRRKVSIKSSFQNLLALEFYNHICLQNVLIHIGGLVLSAVVI